MVVIDLSIMCEDCGCPLPSFSLKRLWSMVELLTHCHLSNKNMVRILCCFPFWFLKMSLMMTRLLILPINKQVIENLSLVSTHRIQRPSEWRLVVGSDSSGAEPSTVFFDVEGEFDSLKSLASIIWNTQTQIQLVSRAELGWKLVLRLGFYVPVTEFSTFFFTRKKHRIVAASAWYRCLCTVSKLYLGYEEQLNCLKHAHWQHDTPRPRLIKLWKPTSREHQTGACLPWCGTCFWQWCSGSL